MANLYQILCETSWEFGAHKNKTSKRCNMFQKRKREVLSKAHFILYLNEKIALLRYKHWQRGTRAGEQPALTGSHSGIHLTEVAD